MGCMAHEREKDWRFSNTIKKGLAKLPPKLPVATQKKPMICLGGSTLYAGPFFVFADWLQAKLQAVTQKRWRANV